MRSKNLQRRLRILRGPLWLFNARKVPNMHHRLDAYTILFVTQARYHRRQQYGQSTRRCPTQSRPARSEDLHHLVHVTSYVRQQRQLRRIEETIEAAQEHQSLPPSKCRRPVYMEPSLKTLCHRPTNRIHGRPRYLLWQMGHARTQTS